MSSHLPTTNGSSHATHSISSLPKTNNFTSHLPPDPAYLTPHSSHAAERSALGPRMVKSALYTYVRPEPPSNPELLGVSSAALRDLGLDPASAEDAEFRAAVSGSKILTFDTDKPAEGDEEAQRKATIYPWAQCYGGFQFGQWAGQLGDGRAISLFEIPTDLGKRYELQLKGAGRTPYSRFADGKAVLRSSIREFVVSEALNALGIPSTRALSLTLCPDADVRRERIEPGAIVARFAESWLRLGTFDLMRSRGDRDNVRRLADYVAEEVFPGWESLPAKLKEGDVKGTAVEAGSGVEKTALQGEGDDQENRYTRLYREIVRRNAKTVAAWQAYAFTNGVLNTDNTSVYGLSIDFGPFAFLDNFDPNYTPNHDDHMLRYSYRNQPSIIWWNLLRTGEAMGELIGSGSRCDEEQFVSVGVDKDWADELIKRAENLITKVGDEYRAVFMAEYKRLMTARLGLKTFKDEDFDTLYSELLDTLEALELDFNHTFRKLSNVTLSELDTEEKRIQFAPAFFHHEGLSATAIPSVEDGKKRIATWLEKWHARVLEDWGEGKDYERKAAMRKVNPKFIPRSWILDELIDRVEKKGERDVLGRVMNMALNPFNEEWGGDHEEEERFCGDVPKYNRAMQCSCSS
ncbi:UPF0061-domain-containing protein [Myriangium duriaei CBS 260.36]|uniref:Selenoprotein O n=1 Tax=Myriangium duriaei CBS 260.36 TaxID=1168546 RepID=A0A9P4MN42_9PEZI|nr:UPF0061-domain-containing protein [Myriangium duriaei CBS 260.36]